MPLTILLLKWFAFLDVLHKVSNALVSSFQGSLDPGYAGGSGLLLLCPQVCS